MALRLVTRGAAMAAVMLIALGAASCGGDDDDDAPASTTAPAADTSPIPAGNGDAVTFVEVDAFDFGFNPDAVAVAAGKELSFAIANTGATAHTFTIYRDEEFAEPVEGADTGNMPDGTVGQFTATLETGDYYFRCEIHPSQMEGEISAD